ncbi:unnamed protein product [Durusdinium trenchii]|uniref:Uncharacterized protein n=1 Tax=Durusdinium trenchii TaxID=1381693 RepID=A0ABP0NWR2_9DINO
MQKTPMIMDKNGKFTPSTYCDPLTQPKYEQEEDLDEVLIEELEMLEDAPETEKKQWKMQDLCDLRFGMEESTLSMLVQVPLDPSAWRELQRDDGSDVFALDVPFGGQQVKFWLKSDPESPILPDPPVVALTSRVMI